MEQGKRPDQTESANYGCMIVGIGMLFTLAIVAIWVFIEYITK